MEGGMQEMRIHKIHKALEKEEKKLKRILLRGTLSVRAFAVTGGRSNLSSSDATRMALRDPTSSNGAREEAMVFSTISLEESLAQMRLKTPPPPSLNVHCSHAEGENSMASTATLAEDEVRLHPRLTSLYKANLAIQSHGTDERLIGLDAFASTSSIRSLMTDSLFSTRTTTDSCPPSPCSSAHIAGPPQCKSLDLIPRPVSSPSRPINTTSCTLRNRGQKTSGSEDGSSHPTSEYGSKSSVHEFSRFTDEDGEQLEGRGLRDDLCELLVEDICNVVSNRLTENCLRKLRAPISHYARIFVERVTHDLEDSDTLNMTPVIYQTFGSSEYGSTSSTPAKLSLYGSFGHESKRESRYEHDDSDPDDNDDADSGPPMGFDERQRSRRNSAREAAMSCPYRKRNPMRFNVRSHASCALSDFPSMTHLRRHIKAFHLKSGEECRRCGAWFESTEDLFDHVNRPTVCARDAGDPNPEDGIGHSDLQNLYDKKVQTWNDVWMILFPDLSLDIPFKGFDPPVELDEVETRCYGLESVDYLSEVFQQIALSSPKLSPRELSQRALSGSVGFIASTLQRCRDLHGHTPSSSRQAKTQEFLERVQNISFEAPRVQAWASDSPTERSPGSPSQVHSQQSHDSGIALLAESVAWGSLRAEKEAPKQYCDQETKHLSSSDVMAETPTTQASPPESHFVSAGDEYNTPEEEDNDFQYEQLVENLANLVIKSQWVTPMADDCMSIIKFTHAYLENIRSHHDGLCITQKFPVSLSSSCDDGEDLGSSLGGQDTSGLLNANGKRKQDGGHRRRRKKNDRVDDNPNGDGPDDSENPDNWAGDRKRARTDDCPEFPCPYRIRHPTRFNIREHQQCAFNTFASMARLNFRRHIKVFHQSDAQGDQCARCRRYFPTEDDITRHLRQTPVCEIRSGRDEFQDPEDGITRQKLCALMTRGKGQKVDTWDAVWKLLFPADHSVPGPHYEEPVELEEVQEKCYQEQSITLFFQRISHLTHEDGYLYIVKVFRKIRKTFKHVYSDERRQKDRRFLEEHMFCAGDDRHPEHWRLFKQYHGEHLRDDTIF
ncbi:hypothetical protein KVR01_009369 [Diaporthe batatas]|uniref:uncharacterized protein n=1 Tax=Diaporthe batatas TaxID=748121 RepID=UPI001D050FDD|nr:uncharacterized protein KVR01_009369 [Diaporthe batatas]KAG8161105.1 hypothetical protein KVR01_009369 [Diaporthe batatas]